MSDTIRLLYDVDLKRPACVLLQAAAGGNTYLLRELFPSEAWLDHPTDGMQMLVGSREQWERLAAEHGIRVPAAGEVEVGR